MSRVQGTYFDLLLAIYRSSTKPCDAFMLLSTGKHYTGLSEQMLHSFCEGSCRPLGIESRS